MYDDVYESYKQKCKELGIKPSPKLKIFAEDIVKKQNDDHVDVATLSKARKQKTPVLSETAKKALVVPRKHKLKLKKSAAIKLAPAPKPKKGVIAKIKVKKIVIPRPKIEKPVKQIRVSQSDEEKKANARERARLYYEKNKDKVNTLNKEKRKSNPKKIILSDEEKKALKKEKARPYHLARKDDPAYQARRKATAMEWNKNNKEKIAASNKKYREEVRTLEQLEEKRAKAREYRQKNLEHMREKDRARKDQRREYLNSNPEAREKRREYDRKRYAQSMADAAKAEKLREKWRRDSECKRQRAWN